MTPSLRFIPALAFFASSATAAPLANAGRPDPSAVVARADLDYAQAPDRSEAGLPIGNGRMGSLVWTVPSALKLQINRDDVFGNGSGSRSFPERNTDYCGACGWVDLDFAASTQDAFPPAETKSRLSCTTGIATVAGRGVTVRALAVADTDVIALEVDDSRTRPDPIEVDLRMLRPPEVRTRSHLAVSKLEVRGDRIALTQKFTEDEYSCASAVVVEALGRSAEVRQTNDRELRLLVPAAAGKFTVLIASAASFDPKEDLVARAGQELDSAAMSGFAGLASGNAEWWRDFWSRSFVRLHSSDGVADTVERNYTYFLYLMGSSSRGRYPAKFNGMLWATGGDLRRWGGQYWGANQSAFYNNALFASNHLELMEPMWNLYSGMLDACALAARQQWGSQGVYIPETVGFDGPARLPDDIASEMRELYLLRKPWDDRSRAFLDYAATMIPYSSRWNWTGPGAWKLGRWVASERGSGPYGPTSHIFSRGAKIAYQYWLEYEYTGDLSWLRNRAYPVVKGIAEFYRNYPNLSKEADGLYHINRVNSNEPLWGGRDTDEEVSSMMGIFPVAIRAAELLQVDPDLRAKWAELGAHLAPLPLDSAGRWVKARPPAIHGRPESLPDGNTMPMWFFDLCTLESDPAVRRTADVTLDAFLIGPRSGRVGILSKIPLVAATMGRAEAVRKLIPLQINDGGPRVFANRMDLSEGPQSTNVERLGNAADAVHTALCQDFPAGPAQPPVIRVFPAWPKDWDADFTLLCRGGFLVSSRMQSGRIEWVGIRSQLGGECRLRNPWPDSQATLVRKGGGSETLKGPLFVIGTSAGEEIALRYEPSG